MDMHETKLVAVTARTLESVADRGGLALLTAPPGAGKSVAVMMAQRSEARVRRVVLIEGLTSPRALYRHVAMTLGIDTPTHAGAPDLAMAVASEVRRQGLRVVLDGGQRLRRPAQLDWVASLADLLPCLTLVGPPALRARVADHEELDSMLTIPVQFPLGVERGELEAALGGQFSTAWLDVVHQRTAGAWRRIRSAVLAAQSLSKRAQRTTRELTGDDADALMGAVMLRPHRAAEVDAMPAAPARKVA